MGFPPATQCHTFPGREEDMHGILICCPTHESKGHSSSCTGRRRRGPGQKPSPKYSSEGSWVQCRECV